MRKKFQINYKTGKVVTVKATSLEVTRDPFGGRQVTWSKDITPRPLWLNVDEVESVWAL